MSRSIDAWDDTPSRPTLSFASASASSSNKPKIPANTTVRDDWEMDDDEEGEEVAQVAPEEQNRRIWEDANTKEHHPMPTVVISRGVSAPITTPSLPLHQPPAMRILKRPSASPSQSSTNLTSPAGETFQEKEARYQIARERIFGAANEESKDAADKGKDPSSKKAPGSSTPPPPSSATKVVREPRGPPNSSDILAGKPDARGFGERKVQRPPPSNVASVGTIAISPSDIPI